MASRAGATDDGHYSSYNFEQWFNGDGGSDSKSHDDDNSEVLPEDKEYMKAIANRVPKGPSDCNRGMYVWPSTVGPKHNERRGKGRAAPKLCKRPQGSGSLSGRVFLAFKGFLRCVGGTKNPRVPPFSKIEEKTISHVATLSQNASSRHT